MAETDVFEDLIKHYTVRVWSGFGWILVSQHKYRTDAEAIESLIRQGETRERVKDAIAKQDSRCNKLLLRYWQNWNGADTK